MSEEDGRWVEYAGGYSDMLRQRAPAGEATTAPAPKSRRAALEKTAPVARALSFKERHQLDTLPVRIASLETERTTLAAKLTDDRLYTRDPSGFAKITTRLATLERELAQAEELWLALELKREST